MPHILVRSVFFSLHIITEPGKFYKGRRVEDAHLPFYFQFSLTSLSLPQEAYRMKFKFITLLSLVLTFAFSACHYGVEAVQQDMERNEEYKATKAQKESETALPEDAAAKMNSTTATDSTATETAPAAQ